MPNSRSRKKRLAEKHRKESKQTVERRLSTTSMNPALLQSGGAGQRRKSFGCSSRIRSDSTSSSGDSCGEDFHDDQAGVLTSAYSWLSYGLDYVLPSRKLVRELEETKEKLKEAETELKKEKKKSRRSMTLGVSFGTSSISPALPPPPPCPVMAAPPPPPPPPLPPMELLLPKPLIIKRGKRSSSASSAASAASSSRPLVTIADLKNIKLRPAERMTTRAQARKESAGGPMVSLQQLQAVRLKRSHTLGPKSMNNLAAPLATAPFAKRLRRLDIKRSPGGTPLSLAAEQCALKENMDMTPIFSVALKQRFSTAMPNSPISTPDESDSSFLSSDGFG